MKLAQSKFFVILFSLVILYSFCEDIPEIGFNEFELKPGEIELVYRIPQIPLESRKSPFISFLFTEENISLVYKEEYEMEKEDHQKIEPVIVPKDIWNIVPLIYLQNKTSYPFETMTFIINNKNSFSAKMILIDNSKDINISLEQFLNWNYKIFKIVHIAIIKVLIN